MQIDIEKSAERFLNQYDRNIRRLSPFNRTLVREFARKMNTHVSYMLSRPNKPFAIVSEGQKGKRVAILTPEANHLTGGRYHTWCVGIALQALGYDVTVYTNRTPVFHNDLSVYDLPKLKIACEYPHEVSDLDIEADIYIGSPIRGNVAAVKLGQKYNKPSYCLIFDPFPMMEKYLGKKHNTDWGESLDLIRNSDCNIIVSGDTTGGYIPEWLNKKESQVVQIPPFVNNKTRDSVTAPKKGNYVLFISRLVRHKHLDHVLEAVKPTNMRLKIISSTDGIGAEKMVRAAGMKNRVDWHWKCSDEEKFELIYGARAMINGSIFEGWGIYVCESLACGVPFVGYNLPTFGEIRRKTKSKGMYLAKTGNVKDLTAKLQKALEEDRNLKIDETFSPDSITEFARKAIQ